jgi:hypothetical protein
MQMQEGGIPMSSVKLDETDARIESKKEHLLIQFPRDGGVV